MLVALDPGQDLTPVVSGRFRSSRTSRCLPALEFPDPSGPMRNESALAPSVKPTIGLWTPARRMFFSIRRACPSSSSTMTMVTALVSPSYGRNPDCLVFVRQHDLKRRSFVKHRTNGDVASEIAHHGPHMREANSFPRLVLLACAPKQLENAPQVPFSYASTIVDDLDTGLSSRRVRGSHLDRQASMLHRNFTALSRRSLSPVPAPGDP